MSKNVGIKYEIVHCDVEMSLYREPAKGLQILLSKTQAGPGRAVKEEQEEISPNHVQAIYGASVHLIMI